VSVAAIVETLAKEFSVDRDVAQRVFDLLTGGFKVPTIARYRRSEIGSLNDGTIRRFQRRMRHLEDLDKRRGTLLRSIEEQRKTQETAGRAASGSETDLGPLEACMDRFELEDLFLPHRRPEPEVQLAIDRGLEALADELVAPSPESKRSGKHGHEKANEEAEPGVAPTEGAAEEQAPATEAPAAEATAEDAASETPTEEPKVEASAEDAATPDTGEASGPAAEAKAPAAKTKAHPAPVEHAVHGLHIELTPELARACAAHVNPDRGIHTDEQALEGAVRILSDRLGRNPSLRGVLRRAMRKHGRMSVRSLVPEKELGRNRSLLKLNTPIRQLQGHKLLSLRQAQSQRQIAPSVNIDESLVLPKVRAALGKHLRPEFEPLADAVAEQALRQRLLPMIEDEVRNELRERADEEAIRFLAHHLRQILLTPPAGPRPVAGLHVDAKGDWLIVQVDREGNPAEGEIRIAAGSEPLPKLAEALAESLRDSGVRAIAVGNGKNIRQSVQKLREAIELLGAGAHVFLVNEAGLASYANSEPARRELPDHTVPARQAIGIARRLQDPLAEFLKSDVRHLGLGREQGIVSKANLRRLLHDTVESCVAHVGCDLNTAPLSLLRHVPGLNYDLAKVLVERRAQRPFTSREDLRTEGLLDDLAWTNAVGFLRVPGSPEPLDRTALHPEQYDLARRMIHDAGGSVEETLGHRDALKGLHREPYELDEYTWRDFTREVSHPGRDPRMRLFPPTLLSCGFDPKELKKDQVVEGIVSNVTSFGAFVDLGIPQDGMVHISEISTKYVRDARVLLSIGQVVRGRVLNSSGPRVELSLKNVPYQRRRTGGSGDRKHAPRPHRGGQRGREEESWPDHKPVMRAARSRRDGLVTGSSEKERKRRGPGGRGRGPGRPGGGGRRDRRGKDDQYDPAAVREASKASGNYNPFASFFKERGAEESEEQATE
jgi:uncharacterized protein